jgi:hypothetical protein
MEGMTYTEPSNLRHTPTEQGPGKVRRNTTSNYIPVTCTYEFTTAQLNVFRTFLAVDLVSGAVEFDWWHPIDKVPCAARIDPERMPVYTRVSGDDWRAQLSLWIVP